MSKSEKTASEIQEENLRLKARAAQLEDRLDHLVAHGEAKTLRELEELQRVTLAAISDAVLITDDSGRLTYVSPNVHFIFGHSQKDVEQQGEISYLLPNTLFSLGELKMRKEIHNIECLIRDSVGRARDLLVSVRCVNVQGGTILYTCRDVTERKKVETELERLTLTLDKKVEERLRELRESREQFRRLVEGLQDEYYFYAADPAGVVTYISPSAYKILGYMPEQLVGHHWSEFFGDPASSSYTNLEEAARRGTSGLAFQPFQFESIRADGKHCWLEVRGFSVTDEDGRLVASEGIVKDVTTQHDAQEALRNARDELERRVAERTAELSAANERLKASEMRYRSVVEDSPKFIVRWRGDGIRTFVNEAFCRYKGMTQEELLGSSFMPCIVEEDRQKFKQLIGKLTPESPVIVDEHRVVMPDGRIVWQRWANRALFDDAGRIIEFQAVGSDITEHRRTEQENRERAVAEAQIHHLTPRELDVMRLVVLGDANKVIARKLNLSIKTIEKHRSSLMKKLRVRSVPELVRLAMLAEGDKLA